MHNLLPGALETRRTHVEDGAGSPAESSPFRGGGVFTETLPPDEAGDSGRGGGGVDVAEEVDVSYVEDQGDRSSTEDGVSESDHERKDDGEENGGGGGGGGVGGRGGCGIPLPMLSLPERSSEREGGEPNAYIYDSIGKEDGNGNGTGDGNHPDQWQSGPKVFPGCRRPLHSSCYTCLLYTSPSPRD